MKTLIVSALTLALFASFIQAQKPAEDCLTMNFHYLVLADEQRSPAARRIDVFLDEKAFSEENLKTLFKYLSKKYTGTKILIIVVSTSWAQLPLPSDCPPVGLSSISDKPEEYEYHQAEYFRDEKVEYFRYNPVLKTENFKKVTLKGKE